MDNDSAIEVIYNLSYDFGTGVDFDGANKSESVGYYMSLLEDAISLHYAGSAPEVSVRIGTGNTDDQITIYYADKSIQTDGGDVDKLRKIASDLFYADWFVYDDLNRMQ